MDTLKQKVAAQEIQKFCSGLKNLIEFGSEIENVTGLEDRAAQASRTLADAEKRHEGILAHVNIDEASAAAEKRIADLKAQEQKATSAKEQAQTSLAEKQKELATVSAELATAKKTLAEFQTKIREITGLTSQ